MRVIATRIVISGGNNISKENRRKTININN